jgi:hypothetical protein
VLGGDGGVKRLGEDEVAERLRTLRCGSDFWHVHGSGQFSSGLPAELAERVAAHAVRCRSALRRE